VRPLDRFYTRVHGGYVYIGPRYSRQQRAARFSPRDPGEPLDGIGQYLYPSRFSTSVLPPTCRHAQAPGAPRCPRPEGPPPPPGEGNGNGAPTPLRSRPAPRRESPSSTGSTSAPRSRRGIRWLMFRKVPKGINWFYTLGSATLFAFLNQAVTGVFLAMYYRPDASGGAYESIRNINDNVFLGQFVRGMHKWGASVMIILIFLHMGRTCSSSAPTSTRAS
jgi:hypothetical protein